MIHNYNGSGRWSVKGVVHRYEELCAEFNTAPRKLKPMTHTDGDVQWIYPIMDAVIEGIRAHDPACIAIGVDFICESASFPFGMTLKSQAARALKNAPLTPTQLSTIRTRVAGMLLDGYLPQEYRFYSRLLRRTGLGSYRNALLALHPTGHRMERYCAYVRLLASDDDA